MGVYDYGEGLYCGMPARLRHCEESSCMQEWLVISCVMNEELPSLIVREK